MVGPVKKARTTGDEYSAIISNPTSRCTLTWWFDKVKGGVEKHDSRLNLFRQSPFSFLLHITSFRCIGALFHLLFERYKGDLVFEIGGRRLQFTEMDFALITGLKTGDLTVPKISCTTSTLRDKYFKEYPVLKKHLMDVFERLVDTNKHEDVVKVALLLVVEYFLRGTEPKTMCNIDYIHLVDSLDDFYMYPWGSLGYNTMSQGIESAVAASSSPRYSVYGCVLPLQVWAVEILPALQECVVSYVPHKIPRFIQYRGWKGWRYKRIHAIFESRATSVVMKLEPTLREWETDAVRSVRDSFQLAETQEDDEEGNEIDHEEDDESDDNDEKGVEGKGPRVGIMKNVIFMKEFRIEREELKKEREELKKERDELRKEREEIRRKEAMFDERKEAMFNERETLLKEKEQLKREKDLFFENEKLANEREKFNKEKEGSRTQKRRFMMEEEGEELRKRGEVNDIDDKELRHGDLDVQSYSNVKDTTINPRHFQQLDLGSLARLESITFDPLGHGPYTGVSDGRVLKWQGAASGWTEFAVTSPHRNEECDGHDKPWLEDTCSRPLGLQFSKATGDLYIADAYHGLFVVGPTGGLATQLANGAQGVPFRFTNGLDIDQATGIVYFTDSSIIYTKRDNTLVTISSDRTGRLLKYDPQSKKVTVLLKGLVYPNGVAISKDSTFLLIVETSTQRIMRFWLQGSKAGALEVFAQLSGHPDNIKRNSRGEFWVAIASINGVIGMCFNEKGEIMEVLNDKFGKITSCLSEVGENNGSLWLGSVVAPDVGIYKL